MEHLKTEIEASIAFWAMVVMSAIVAATGTHLVWTTPLFIACVAIKWRDIKSIFAPSENRPDGKPQIAITEEPSAEMELAGMRALRNTLPTVSGAYSREQARACWDAMIAARGFSIAVMSDKESKLRDLLLLARAEIYHNAECVPGQPCKCENGELMRRIDEALKA